jgi:erythromycin esterase-like protein
MHYFRKEDAMDTLVKLIHDTSTRLTGSPRDYDPLLDSAGDGRFVLLGEASHGTHEFYRERARITQRLISEKGFNTVVTEADWPDAYQINRFAHGRGPADAVEALDGFRRFPQWMWRNADVLDFVGWLRSHNDGQKSETAKTSFYGLDLYSLHSSIEAVLQYLGRIDPESARRAREHYGCFDHFGADSQRYGMAAGLGLAPSCEDAVVKELMELRKREGQYLERDGAVAADELFCAKQNALVVKNAEQYYRSMFRSEVSSWNLRDQHMMETLMMISSHLEEVQKSAKIVVWAHNSHLGDARATQMGRHGELNLGQLVRERCVGQSFHIGFTTCTGTVAAASEWDGPAERKKVRAALPGSYEDLFHQAGHPCFWLEFGKHPQLAVQLTKERLERAIGVIYRPDTERASHYFKARLAEQFDAVLHFDETRAVEPLERSARKSGEVEETFPSGF